MDRDDFQYLLIHTFREAHRQRMIRITLVRFLKDTFFSKLTTSGFSRIKMIPLSDDYRFVVSSLTHSEFSEFKRENSDQLGFLRIDSPLFADIVDIAEKHEFTLTEYYSSGPGKMAISSSSAGRTLLEDMLSKAKEGFLPYMIKVERENSKMRIRADFNIFASKMGFQEASLVYDIAHLVLSKRRELFEYFFRMIHDGGHLDSASCLDLTKTYRFEPDSDPDRFYEILSRRFEIFPDTVGSSPERLLLKEKNTGRWAVTLIAGRNYLAIKTGSFPTMESLLIVDESVREWRGENGSSN